MVHFSTSPKQCFCTTLQNKHKNNIFSLNVIWLFYWKLQKHVVHGLSIHISFRYRNSIQQVFEMSSLRVNTRLQTLSSLADSSVNNTLLQNSPNVNQSPLEFVDIVDLHLVHMLLREPPNLVINGVQVRTVGGHSSGEMESAVSRCRSSIVSRTRCAGALSCWKTKLSPPTCLIAGNICCDEEHPGNIWRLLPRVRRRKAQQRPYLTLRLTPDTEAVFCFFIVYNHFLISQGSAETLFRRGGKINHLSIA